MMKLNKRVCRRYAIPDHMPNPNCGVFHIEKITHIVQTAIKMIDGHRTLVLYVHLRENIVNGNNCPIWTMFQSRDDFITLAQKEDGTTTWRTSTFDHLDRDYYFTSHCAFYTAKDDQRVTSFCKSNLGSGFSNLRCLQDQIATQRELVRQHSREQKVIERMEGIPPIPSNLKRWAHKNVLPAYFFYDYRRRAKSVTGFCTSCQKEVMLGKARHNEKGICPACGREFTMKARGRRSYINDSENYQVVQQTRSGELLIRIFHAYYHYAKASDIPNISHSESARIFVSRTPDGRFCEEPFYYSHFYGDLTHWKAGSRPAYRFGYYIREDETCCKLYCQNLSKALTETAWQYCPLEQFYSVECEPIQVTPFLKAYLVHPKLEHLVKVGFSALVSDLVYKWDYGKLLDETQNRTHRILQVNAEDVTYLRQCNVNRESLQDFQKYCERNVKGREELHRWQEANNIRNIDTNILRLLPYMTAHKLIHYMEQQFSFLRYRLTPGKNVRYGSIGSLLTEYCDYLRMCEEEAYDLSNDFVLFPKDIQKAHDRVSRQIKVKANAKLRHDFKIACKRIMNQLDFERNGMKILYPAKPDDIVAEGHALHHCVGSYVDRVAKQECIILFLRQIEQMDKPFYTIEVRNQKVIQVRGERNAEATKEVSDFMKQWEKRVLQHSSLPTAA